MNRPKTTFTRSVQPGDRVGSIYGHRGTVIGRDPDDKRLVTVDVDGETEEHVFHVLDLYDVKVR